MASGDDHMMVDHATVEAVDAISSEQLLAELAGLRGPAPEVRGGEVLYHGTDVALLCRIVVRARMVAGNRHGPAAFPDLQLPEEPRGIADVFPWLQHFGDRPELLSMIVMIDLHASQINQLLARRPGFPELHDRLPLRGCKHASALDVEGVGVQLSFSSRFRESNRIENTKRNNFSSCRGRHLPLADVRNAVLRVSSLVRQPAQYQYQSGEIEKVLHHSWCSPKNRQSHPCPVMAFCSNQAHGRPDRYSMSAGPFHGQTADVR